MIKNKNEIAEYLAAISIGLAILAGGVAFMFYMKWKDAEDRVGIYESQSAVLTQHSEAINYNVQKELEAINKQLDIVLDSNAIFAILKSFPRAPAAWGKVFWNSSSKEVFLSVNNLPATPGNSAYCLWAEKDGKYTNLGTLDSNSSIQKMNNIESVKFFLVTLEKKDDNIFPSLEKIYLKGGL